MMRLASLPRVACRVPWGARLLSPACRVTKLDPSGSPTSSLLQRASTTFTGQESNVSATIQQLSDKKGEWDRRSKGRTVRHT